MKAAEVNSTFRAVTATSMAAGLITGFDNAVEEGVPLTQVQQIHVTAMMFMAYRDAVRDFEESIAVEEALAHEARSRRRSQS